MRLPPLLRAFSLAAIDDVLASIHGTSRLDFTPSHALTRIVGGVVLDVNRADPWDLVSEGATATDARMDYGKPDHHSRSRSVAASVPSGPSSRRSSSKNL